MTKRWPLIAGAILIIASLALAGCAAQPTSASANPAPQTVYVGTDDAVKKPTIAATGKGEIKVTPDVAYVSVGVTTQNADAKKASADNANKMDALYKAVKALGIDEKDIKTVNIGLNPQYDYNGAKPKITGYMATNTVSITVRDVKKTGDVIDAAVNAGGNDLNGVSFDLLDKSKAYSDALTAAVKDAKAKVDAMAGAAGITQITPFTITESSYQAYPVYSGVREAADAAKGGTNAPTQVSAGEMTITASVTAEFQIVK